MMDCSRCGKLQAALEFANFVADDQRARKAGLREALVGVLQVACDGDECSTLEEYQELLNKIAGISVKVLAEQEDE